MTRTVTVGDVTFGSPMFVDSVGCEWVLSGIGGWDNSGAAVRRESPDRPQAHGSFDQRGWRGGRSVGLSGTVLCPTRADAAGVVQRLNSLLADGSAGDLTVVDDDLPTMSASVRLADTPVVDWSVASGRFVGFQLEFWAADPLRYGVAAAVTTSFPERRGGLRFPLFRPAGRLSFGARSTTGQVEVANVGTAPSQPQFTITGPVPEFQIVEVASGRRLIFSRPVNAGDVLVIDSATGLVVLNGGDVDYSGYLTTAEWTAIPAGGSATYAFLPLDGTGTGTMTVTFRPAFW